MVSLSFQSVALCWTIDYHVWSVSMSTALSSLSNDVMSVRPRLVIDTDHAVSSTYDSDVRVRLDQLTTSKLDISRPVRSRCTGRDGLASRRKHCLSTHFCLVGKLNIQPKYLISTMNRKLDYSYC